MVIEQKHFGRKIRPAIFVGALFFFTFSQAWAQLTFANSTSDNGKLSKLKLADELAKIEGLDTVLNNAIQNANLMLQRDSKKKTRFTEKNYGAAKEKYERLIPELKTEAAVQLSQLLAKQFSEAELKYLIDLSKNSLNRRFHHFIESDDYNFLVNSPYEKVTSLLVEFESQSQKKEQKK